MAGQSLLAKLLIWRIKHINNRNFVLLLSGVIGVVAGLAAVLLKETVHFIQHQLTLSFSINYANYLYLAYPFVGLLLTVFITRYLLRDKLGHGISDILFTISKKSSIIRRSKMYSRMLTSALTVGFGGSVGLEAPIVVTGSAIGSNVAQLMHLNYKKRTLLIGCGAAGAISAIFNSPIAGVIFAVEVILAEVTIASFIPLLIASVFGSLISLILLGNDILFQFRLTDPFVASDTPFYLLLGILCGLVSIYFTRCMRYTEAKIERVKHTFGRAALGGILLGLIIFVFPQIYGEGYDIIKAMLSSEDNLLLQKSFFSFEDDNVVVLLLVMLGVLLIKPVASALTLGAGGSGGIFAPSLFMGGVTGFLFARSINYLAGSQLISPSNFTLVGMCGIMSGVQHAPLTAIFLIAELTSGYTLFVPLMLVSAIAYTVSSYYERYSFYTSKLIEHGDFVPQSDRDKQVLNLIELQKLVETDLLAIHPKASVDELVKLVKVSKRNVFPVVEDGGSLKGIITLDDIREIMFDAERRKVVAVETLMRTPPAKVSFGESMDSVMQKFEQTGAWNLPVIDQGRYVGFVSKSRIFNAYRKRLIRQTQD